MKKEEIKLIKDDVTKYTYLDELNIQEAGNIFKEALRKDISSMIYSLIGSKEDHFKLIKLITEIEVRLDMLTATKYAKTNKEGAIAELEQAIKEQVE